MQSNGYNISTSGHDQLKLWMQKIKDKTFFQKISVKNCERLSCYNMLNQNARWLLYKIRFSREFPDKNTWSSPVNFESKQSILIDHKKLELVG